MQVKAAYFFLILLSGSLVLGQTNETESNKPRNRSYAEVELTSNYVEDAYTQTENSVGVVTDIGYKFEQFRVGVRANNVHFDGETAHVTLRPHLAILANFSDISRFFIEYESRMYFADQKRNGAKSSLGYEYDNYRLLYESRANWEGLELSKARVSLAYLYQWDQDFFVDYRLGYNVAEEVNTPPFLDGAVTLQYPKDHLIYYTEVILLSNTYFYFPNGQNFIFRLGAKASF